MLDLAIWVSQRMHGVVCHEHVGPPRVWSPQEEELAYGLASMVSLVLVRKR